MNFYIYKAIYCTMLESPFKPMADVASFAFKHLPAQQWDTHQPSRSEKSQMDQTFWVAC
jgi:hypothetical protein